MKRNQPRNPALRGMRSRWLAHEGQPSWHQARAGHISAGATVFSGDDAELKARALVERWKLIKPTWCWVAEELVPISEGK